MTDRELLDLAAKAAGITYMVSCSKQGLHISSAVWWNPLQDDGDCARMEASLGISLMWYSTAVRAYCHPIVADEPLEKRGGDRQKARRYAATRLAAEIAKAMP